MKETFFEIEHLDPLGQGVSKKEKILFLEKTLPGEKGLAYIHKQSKGVLFGHIKSPKDLTESSKDRIVPECPHFWECSGCQYLHTSYSKELDFKKKALYQNLKTIISPEKFENKITLHPSASRSHYRNRVQLHYDKKKEILGLQNIKLKKIIEIPHCKILNEDILKRVNELYKDQNWLKLVNKKTKKDSYGHIEIYKPEGRDESIAINQSYAHKGFTQVNQVMNKRLKEVLQLKIKLLIPHQEGNILDLFGGNGNLTSQLDNPTTVVDSSPVKKEILSSNQTFFQFNLYKKNALQEFIPLIEDKQFSGFIIDPPRSGLKNLFEWSAHYNPNFIFYISCNPSVLTRDLNPLLKNGYQINGIHLLDFFPSTQHYETMIILKKNVHSK